MKNVHETGHLAEQPTKLNTFRIELGVFHGYTYIRRANTVIEVWIPAECGFCACPIHTSGQFVRTTGTDADIQRHGLRKFEGMEQPIHGARVHTASPYMCDPCRAKWLKGDALEETGNIEQRTYSWN